jgi:hypothetical protein
MHCFLIEMTSKSPSPRRVVSLSVAAAVAVLLLFPTTSFNSKAEDIPHENYDLVKSNLDVVIALLKTSIAHSENALVRMYNESMVQVEENLTVVRGLLTPAELILERIRNIAGSYENLSRLLPPFNSLSAQMDSFSSMEVSLLGARDEVVSASRLASLTGEERLRALDSIRTFNSLILQMNKTIDGMLASANGIIGLVVDGNQPFTDNRLIPLIEQLRDLLHAIQAEIDLITQEGVPWDKNQPFLLLWLSAGDYYLGDQLTGGGYLYFDGAFAIDHMVAIQMDGANLTFANTTTGGRFSFSHSIPLNASWLGSHVLKATTITPVGILNSNTVTISILLIPTSISLAVNSNLLTIEDELVADVQLTDVRERPLENAPCHFILDGQTLTFRTDSPGNFHNSWKASNMGYGTHVLQAFYDGELPYEPSASNVTTIVVDIPTSVSLNLFATRYYTGYSVVGNGTLFVNGTTPMSNQDITLSIDGVVVANLTTGQDGQFAFSVSTDSMAFGGHTIVAAFLHRESIWRYSQDEKSFTVYGHKLGKYPFWPVIPKWSFGPPAVTIPYLFVGQYAYFFWLLVLMAIAISVRVIQMRDKRKRLQPSKTEILESLERVAEPGTIPAATMAELAKDMLTAEVGPANPNERIVWYYQRLLAFLSAKANIAIRTSMTHWEVARILKVLGFPIRPVEKATILFERALYSGASLSDDDVVMMSTALTDLVRVGSKGGLRAG